MKITNQSVGQYKECLNIKIFLTIQMYCLFGFKIKHYEYPDIA